VSAGAKGQDRGRPVGKRRKFRADGSRRRRRSAFASGEGMSSGSSGNRGEAGVFIVVARALVETDGPPGVKGRRIEDSSIEEGWRRAVFPDGGGRAGSVQGW
jgi:hypothetical protein